MFNRLLRSIDGTDKRNLPVQVGRGCMGASVPAFGKAAFAKEEGPGNGITEPHISIVRIGWILLTVTVEASRNGRKVDVERP